MGDESEGLDGIFGSEPVCAGLRQGLTSLVASIGAGERVGNSRPTLKIKSITATARQTLTSIITLQRLHTFTVLSTALARDLRK